MRRLEPALPCLPCLASPCFLFYFIFFFLFFVGTSTSFCLEDVSRVELPGRARPRPRAYHTKYRYLNALVVLLPYQQRLLISR
jgi:hypothetical protein